MLIRLLGLGLLVGSADATWAAITGFRVPAFILAVTIVVDVLALALLAALIGLCERVIPSLCRGADHRAGRALLLFGLCVAIELLFHHGFRRGEAFTVSGVSWILAVVLVAIVFELALRRTRPRMLSLPGLIAAWWVLGLAIASAGLVQRFVGRPPIEWLSVIWMGAFGAAVLTLRPALVRTRGGAVPALALILLLLGGAAPFAANALFHRDFSDLPNGSTASQSPRPNLVLISIDTLRADAVGPRPDGSSDTPVLDTLARRGTSYANAFSPGAWTLPTHATMLTGVQPPTHGALLPIHRLSSSVPTLAEILREAGYRTVALTAGGYVEDHYGLERGFELFDDDSTYRFWFGHHPAFTHLVAELPIRRFRDRFDLAGGFHRVVDRAVDWWRSEPPEPFFLFLHTYEVHDYMSVHAWWDDLARSKGLDDARLAELAAIGERSVNHWPEETFDDFRLLYEAALAWTDRQIGRLLLALEEEGLAENTWIVVTSDHGEGFDVARNRVGHGGRLHDDLVHVPLIVVPPDGRELPAPGRMVGLVDVAPTLLEAAGLDAPSMEGVSLLSAPAEDETAVFGQEAYERSPRRIAGNHPLRDPESWQSSLRTRERKYLWTRHGWEVYAVDEDPEEREDLSRTDDAVPEEIALRLEEFRRSWSGSESSAPSTPEQRRRLEALGYVDHGS